VISVLEWKKMEKIKPPRCEISCFKSQEIRGGRPDQDQIATLQRSLLGEVIYFAFSPNFPFKGQGDGQGLYFQRWGSRG
jgi:hypothetical protein